MSEQRARYSGRVVSSGRNNAKRTWSDLCQRWFDSRVEARRGEELAVLFANLVIDELDYQPVFVLSVDPKVTYRPDFRYRNELGRLVYEDVKGGPITRELRVKLAWLRLQGIEIDIVRVGRNGWEVERL